MAIGKPAASVNDTAETARDAARSSRESRLTAIVSAVALAFSAYSLWESALKRPDIKVFVPPVIQYASPYQNSNFEVFALPLTMTNEGARTGTVLFVELEVTDPEKNLKKRFYSAELGRWTMDNARAGNFKPFAPISLAGRASMTESVLFYTRRDEKVMQIVQGIGRFKFALKLHMAEVEDFGFLDRLWKKDVDAITFEMTLPEIDHRAFQRGTVPLYQKDWRTTIGGG